jgi:hypothetical protein
VPELNRDQLQRLARLGAQARLEELRREEAAIRAAFPDLSGRGGRGRGRKASAAEPAAAPTVRRRRRRSMSPAARKAVSDRMRKYWAERRKAKGSKSGK